MSQRLNCKVEDVTKMPYVQYLFWITFFREYDREQEQEMKKNRR